MLPPTGPIRRRRGTRRRTPPPPAVDRPCTWRRRRPRLPLPPPSLPMLERRRFSGSIRRNRGVAGSPPSAFARPFYGSSGERSCRCCSCRCRCCCSAARLLVGEALLEIIKCARFLVGDALLEIIECRPPANIALLLLLLLVHCPAEAEVCGEAARGCALLLLCLLLLLLLLLLSRCPAEAEVRG